MVEIVKFERKNKHITIGFRKNNAVVLADVPSTLSDVIAKQKAYEQVYAALQYEADQSVPSIDGAEMKSIEWFTPEISKVNKILIIGENSFIFNDHTQNKNLNYSIIAIDQYGNKFSEATEYETIENKTHLHVITKTIDSITATFNINVIGYVDPTPSETDLLRQDIESLADSTAVVLEDTTAIAETTAMIVEDNTATAETLAHALLEIENLKAEVTALKGA